MNPAWPRSPQHGPAPVAPKGLNYHHLLYFWTVAREGSVTAAARRLGLAQSTVSGQLRRLEQRLGHPLFQRQGRGIVLTDVGRLVHGYADEIFGLGRELLEVANGRLGGRAVRFTVGITDGVPKLIAHRLLEPVFRLREPIHLVCREGQVERLLANLALHELDVVIAETPIPADVAVKGSSHLLGQCGVTLFAAAELAARHRKGFPRSLDGAPLLLPTDDSVLRRSLDAWFAARGIAPRIAGEFAGPALLKVFGQGGRGLFPGPTVIEREIVRQYRVRVVGRLPDCVERFYAISAERRREHPAVIALAESARDRLFG
jgi:LysR family transcriptional activator of nhaA